MKPERYPSSAGYANLTVKNRMQGPAEKSRLKLRICCTNEVHDHDDMTDYEK